MMDFCHYIMEGLLSPMNLENFIYSVTGTLPRDGAAYGAARRRYSRAINAIHRPCRGWQGATSSLGDNDTSTTALH